ncbi:MAG: hypothetical protein Ta2B_04750 [Termitinemataceae bacterium]|nr:MAG: hypothetical protein Ta2B_04750 [Termitinemataceae bacterium]
MIGNIYNKWLYYGFTKEDVKKCENDILRHNTVSLSVTCAVTSLLMLILSFYPYENQRYHGLFYVFAGIVALGFVFAHSVFVRKCYTKKTVAISLLVFIIGVASFTVFVYGYCQSQFACRFLLVLLSFQIACLFSAHINLLINIFAMALVFSMNFFSDVLPFIIDSDMNNYFDVINVLLTALISMTLNWYIAHTVIKGIVVQQNLQKERNKFLEDSTHDQLTGLNNRRSFSNSVDFYISVCRHVHQSVCVLMMDVDYFKLYNDFYGHQKGDVVLQSIGNILTKLSYEEHLFAARVGGEEFIILWTENRVDEAERVVLKLREMINALNIEHRKSSVSSHVTASYGLYIMRGGSPDSSEELYNTADTALYKAKESGRDCIVLLDSNEIDNYRLIEIRSPDEAGRK